MITISIFLEGLAKDYLVISFGLAVFTDFSRDVGEVGVFLL